MRQAKIMMAISASPRGLLARALGVVSVVELLVDALSLDGREAVVVVVAGDKVVVCKVEVVGTENPKVEKLKQINFKQTEVLFRKTACTAVTNLGHFLKAIQTKKATI